MDVSWRAGWSRSWGYPGYGNYVHFNRPDPPLTAIRRPGGRERHIKRWALYDDEAGVVICEARSVRELVAAYVTARLNPP